jgi:transcriptional regulator with XRE-family HTH domain
MLTQIAEKLAEVTNDETKRKFAFGKRVRSLREMHGLSRHQLEHKSGVPERTIIDVENGEKAVLDRKTVSLLAFAFELHGMAFEEFMRAAGLTPDVTLQPDIEAIPEVYDFVRGFYADTVYPAYMTNGLLDLHSCNSYALALFGISLQYANEHAYAGAGPNVLRMLFDPTLRARETWGKRWRQHALWNIYFFRMLSQHHIHEPRYAQLLAALHRYPDFSGLWVLSNSQAHLPLMPQASALHSTYGPVRVQYVEAVTNEVVQRHLRATMYIPQDEATSVAFFKLRNHIGRMAWQFGSCELARFTRIM